MWIPRVRRWAVRVRHAVRLWWLRHRLGIRIWKGCWIHKSAIFDLNSGGSISVGDGVEILPGAILSTYGGSIEVGDRVYLGPYCVLYGQGGLRVGEDTMIAAHCVIIPSNHGIEVCETSMRMQPLRKVGIEIGRDCWLGTGVKVLDGVTLGDGCVIGAGAVVTRSVPQKAIAMGVPARVTGMRPEGITASHVAVSLDTE